MTDPGFSARAATLVSAFPKCRVLVAGDIMLDEYIWGSVRRISPEAPVPVVTVTRDSRTLGGAANVALNVAGLGSKVIMAGVVGHDAHGRDVVRMMKKNRIDVTGVVACEDRPTTVKTRVIAHNQQVVRVDREMNDLPAGKTVAALWKAILAALPFVDGIVLSDYRKGVLSQGLVENVIRAAKKSGKFVAVDPKQADFAFYRGATLITPNRSEAEAALGGRDLGTDEAILSGGKELLKAAAADAVLITRGEEGMSLVERRAPDLFHIPTRARHVYDVTGAGDTVIGTIAVTLAAKGTLRDAAFLSNIAAGIVVAEVGTVPIDVSKLREAVRDLRRETVGGSPSSVGA